MNRDASTVAETFYVENGERVYPCRCGVTHRGDYAAEDWNHHNCFHGEALLLIDELAPMLLCGLCGQVFHVDEVGTALERGIGRLAALARRVGCRSGTQK